jgi:hypothetical protein
MVLSIPENKSSAESAAMLSKPRSTQKREGKTKYLLLEAARYLFGRLTGDG